MEYFKNAHGYNNGILRENVRKELLSEIYSETDCEACRFRNLQRDLNKLRKLNIKIFCPRASQEVYVWSDKKQRKVKRIQKFGLRKYYHLQEVHEFDVVIKKLETMLEGINDSKNGLVKDRNSLILETEKRLKEQQLRKVLAR